MVELWPARLNERKVTCELMMHVLVVDHDRAALQLMQMLLVRDG